MVSPYIFHSVAFENLVNIPRGVLSSMRILEKRHSHYVWASCEHHEGILRIKCARFWSESLAPPPRPLFPQIRTDIHATPLAKSQASPRIRVHFHQSTALITTTSFIDLFYLTAFVKAFVSVKILIPSRHILVAGNPQTAAFPQRKTLLPTFYLAEKRVQYVSGIFQRGKAT
jgi:hypothetical protein